MSWNKSFQFPSWTSSIQDVLKRRVWKTPPKDKQYSEMKVQEILWYCWVQIWHLERVLGVKKGEEKGGKKPVFHLYVQYGRHVTMLKPKDHQQVLDIHQTARGMEPTLARSSWHPFARLEAMRRDRDGQQTKSENKQTSQYLCTGHATAFKMPPTSLTPFQHGKQKKGHEGDDGEKTRTKKRRGRAACLSQQKAAFLFSVCFSYLNVQSLRPVD